MGKTKGMKYNECPFCELGQAKRILIWRLVKDLSKKELQKLLNKNRRPSDYICHKCGKNCGNAGLLAMHLKGPGRPYRATHRKFDKELEK